MMICSDAMMVRSDEIMIHGSGMDDGSSEIMLAALRTKRLALSSHCKLLVLLTSLVDFVNLPGRVHYFSEVNFLQ